jgi:RNA polymerase sigma-70 factor (ECF subfamily)
MNTPAVRPNETTGEDEARSRRAADAALPHLDAVYTLARYLLRDPSDADDAVQECYLRTLRHFDTVRCQDIKPWLLAILRNVCRVEYGRQSRVMLYEVNMEPDQLDGAVPLWREAPDTPEALVLRKLDVEAIRGLMAALPDVLREVIVLRELDGLSYREIAAIVDAPVGTVMSRLARGRAMLRGAWLKAEHEHEDARGREEEFKILREEARVSTGGGNAIVQHVVSESPGTRAVGLKIA